MSEKNSKFALLRNEFPIFKRKIRSQNLCYLDNAATTQKPQAVIDAMRICYEEQYAAVARGVHLLSQNLTARCEQVRSQVAEFLRAKSPREIVFTPSTTAGLNLLAASLGQMLLKQGDAVLITALEHHANIVPWQMACAARGAELRVLPINAQGELELDNFAQLLDGVKIFACTHASNVLGTINDIEKLNKIAKTHGAITVTDGAQAIAHTQVDVEKMSCDFYVFSGHKIYAPTGIGVLYGRGELLEQMPVYQTGGGMISSVSFSNTSFAPYPQKFEAGTPPVVEIIGLGAALAWIQEHGGVESFALYENQLLQTAENLLRDIAGVEIYGSAANKAPVISFNIKNCHPHDAGTIMDDCAVAVRVGHHCAEPLIKLLQVPATIRASFAVYNNTADIEQFIASVKRVQEFF